MKYIHTLMSRTVQLACVEVGGSGSETVLFNGDGSVERLDGAHRPAGARLAVACPGLIGENGRILGASNLNWYDVDPAEALGLAGPAELVLNDAEAAALGEVALRDGNPDAVFIGVGTGVGAAVVIDGEVVAANLLGHLTGFSDEPCTCTQVGCLETVAAGWALPDPLGINDIHAISSALAKALELEAVATPKLVVLGGGLARRYPSLRDCLSEHAPSRRIENSAAPAGYKSASAWGLRHALERAAMRA